MYVRMYVCMYVYVCVCLCLFVPLFCVSKSPSLCLSPLIVFPSLPNHFKKGTMSMNRYGNVRLFGCNAHQELATAMAAKLGVPLERSGVKKFSNSETKWVFYLGCVVSGIL